MRRGVQRNLIRSIMTRSIPRAPFRDHGASLAVQRRALLAAHPWLSVTVQGTLLTAEGTCQPTPLTARYRVRIGYRLGFSPVAEILDPVPIRRDPRVRVIHTLGRDSVPCLFLPGVREWHARLLLAATIVPWLLEWLVFYEAWHVTGNWVAGGVLPANYPEAASP